MHQPIVETQPIAADAVIQYWAGKNADALSRDHVARACAAFKAAGMSAVAFHLGPSMLAQHWDVLAGIAANAGLDAVAAAGVDGTGLTARQKGHLLGGVLARPSCRALLVDAEGRWDRGGDSDLGERGALELGEELRTVSDKPVGDQPWFAIQSHGDGRPRDASNPFRGFPADEFAASCVNWYRFRQAYANNFPGKNRWTRIATWMEQDWSEFHGDLASAGRADLIRPLGVTLQGYGWRDILPDLVAVLLDRTVVLGQPVFLWSEPNPEACTLAAVRVVHKLAADGFARAGRSAQDAVRMYQRDYNSRAPSDKQLSEDGRAGPLTIASMGVSLD